MKRILFPIMLATPLIAGELNIVHLGPPDSVKIEIQCAGAKQEVELPHGGSTGQFMLPVENATIRVPNTKIPDLPIAATEERKIAVLKPSADGYDWLLIPGKASEKWSLRAVNLTQTTASSLRDGTAVEIGPGTIVDIATKGKTGVSIQIDGGGEFTYKGSEPCAVVAFIHQADGKWKVLFVTDR
jgi:hypothetical protein